MILVSVVIPVYNVEAYLRKCVESVLGQTYQNMEIILLNDGSTDTSGEVCDYYAKIDRRVRVIHKENEGLAETRNKGIAEALGEYILFVDSDDYIHEKTLEWTCEKAEKYAADIVVFDYVSVDEKGREVDQFYIGLQEDKPFQAIEEKTLIYKTPSAWNKLWRREFLLKSEVSFPKGKYYEDLGTVPKWLLLAKRIVYVPKVCYYYLLRTGSIMRQHDFSRNYRDRICMIEDIYRFFRQKESYELFQTELEFLLIQHGYFFPSREIVLVNIKDENLKKFRVYMEKKIPKFKENSYIKTYTRNEKILFWLLVRKMHGVMSGLSRLKHWIKGDAK